MLRGGRGLVESGVVVAAVAGFVLSAVFVVGSTREAVEERRSAAAAMDLRMAATLVAHADQVQSLGGVVPASQLEGPVDALISDPGDALHALEPKDEREAISLLNEIAGHGTLLIEPEPSDHADHDNARLQDLLRTATDASSRDASGAERVAFLALGVMSVLLATAVGLIMRSKSRAVRAQALVMAQYRAGQRFEVLLNDSPDILLVIDDEGRISFRSGSSTRLLEPESHSVESLVSLASHGARESLRDHLRDTSSTGSSALFEFCGHDGESGWFDVWVSDLTDHELVAGHLLTIRDVSSEVRLRT